MYTHLQYVCLGNLLQKFPNLWLEFTQQARHFHFSPGVFSKHTHTHTPQLQEHVLRLRDEVDKERTERNFFQLERDKVNSFWEISQRQLEEVQATVRNKERELGDAEERHQVEIKVSWAAPVILEEN